MLVCLFVVCGERGGRRGVCSSKGVRLTDPKYVYILIDRQKTRQNDSQTENILFQVTELTVLPGNDHFILQGVDELAPP